ncbi:MORN repeat-containing protein [Lentibacillus cibarius]|uniref:Uncharacterized protein n=1 Tax=Lentibacillus cibarius TaxID=2583219 RepID=A0A5S3QIY7_9BACI|nr:hypothetical protein [Lentibacillus cibarius]TMN21892.1 hypothetical protein FFL34_07015 [Lentibacillus cibarius]
MIKWIKSILLSIVIIIGSFLLPLVFNAAYNWVTSIVQSENGKEFLYYFAIDKSTYLTILSIEATTLVALAIYWMQKQAEKMKEMEWKRQARDSLFSTLVASLKEVHELSRLDLHENQDYRFIRISEKHFEALTEIDGIKEEDIRFLNNILKELETLVEYEKEGEVGDIRIHINKLISYIMIPPYVQYRYVVEKPKDAFEVMNEQLLSILRKFDYASESEGKYQYFSQSGDTIIEYDVDGKAIVYNHDAEKVCYAFLDNKGIREGWARLYDERTILYEGEWKDYKKHGQGTEFLNDNGNYQYISKEGIWKSGELWDGKIYDVLVYSDGELIDNPITQINEQFHGNEAVLIKDFGDYGVVNLIVKEGNLIIDSAAPIGEVKATYESKYGSVEWFGHYLHEDDETPNIDIEINETDEVELEFNSAIEIDRLPIPEKVVQDEIPQNLMKYISSDEIETYNAKLPETIEKIEAYNRELEIYEYAKAFGVEIDLSVINDGNHKANNVHIELDFPDELIILKESKENLEEPGMPSLPRSPLDKAWSKALRNDNLHSAVGSIGAMGMAMFSPPYSPKNNLHLWDFVSSTNQNYWTDLNENKISVYCAELLHTRQSKFNSEYLLVPTKTGKFDVNISVICEEYNKEDHFNIQVYMAE